MTPAERKKYWNDCREAGERLPPPKGGGMEAIYFAELKRVVAYAESLEKECARLGNPVANDRNITLRRAKELIKTTQDLKGNR